MNCPVCDARMRTVEKYSVEVDICPDCKGVWLDRGELDKILDAVGNVSAPERIGDRPVVRDSRDHDDHDDDSHRRRESDRDHDHDSDRRSDIDPRTGKPRKRGGWLGDLLDGFGGD